MREIRCIDRGGFGVVHEVEVKGDRFARKSFQPAVPDPDEREKLQRRFVREVRIQRQIHHPNIMPIVAFELEDAPPWFTMPLADESLEKRIKQNVAPGMVDPGAWQDILAGVEELHRLGYVHRDLKPANVLLVNGKWVLADFGLILPMARDTTILTSSKSAYGSHFYAAPEQAYDFRNTTEAADIFALGCILHDAIERNATRVPFSQIRVQGPYGPILEKCTETDQKRRFPTIASLRSALFDLWRTSQFDALIDNDASFLDAVLADPSSVEAWRLLVGHAEGAELTDRNALLRSLNAEHLVQLSGHDDALFGRLMALICEWVRSTGFQWEYCDVIGDRLVEVYRVSPVRIRCHIVLAALDLAVSHNRWHVMNQVGAMLGQTADNGLVDRTLIEIGLDSAIEIKLRTIEEIVSWSRDHWHPKIAEHLNTQDKRTSG